MRRACFLLGLAAFSASVWADKPITITLLHSNDLHAHIESTKIKGKLYGSYARQATVIKKARATEPNVLLLNAGDTFQGTLYFNTYEGLADLAFMNSVGYAAMAVGNHEFDRGPIPLGNFASHALFPVLSANLDVSGEPALSKWIQPSAVVEVGGEKVGIVGATTPDVTNISSPGPTVKLKDLRESVQTAVDGLTKQGINKIFLVTHIGYREDQDLIKQLHDVDVVVGGHSHTPLGTPDLAGWPKSQGPYPTFAKDAKGIDVPIVQCWEWSKVFGHLTLDFDGEGRLKKVANAAPVVLDESIPEDQATLTLVAAFRKPIEALSNQPIGEALGAVTKEAKKGESLMANLIADGMLASTKKMGSVVAFINSGGVRGGLEPGKITYGNAISIQPFGNTLVTLDLKGSELKAAIEEGIGTGGQLTPSAASSYRIDSTAEKGNQAKDIVISGAPLDLEKTYRVTLLNFTANGGDSHFILRDAKGARTDTGIIDLDAMIEFIKSHTPLDPNYEGRVKG